MKLRASAVVIALTLISCVAAVAQGAPQILPQDKLASFLPPRVFIDGENVPTQQRNASGIHLSDHKLTIIALIDTTGYSAAYQEKYSGVIMTQGPLKIGSTTLKPGQYGLGQTKTGEHDKAVVTIHLYDLGGNQLAEVQTQREANMKGVRPEQIVIEKDGSARLYLGPYYTSIAAAK